MTTLLDASTGDAANADAAAVVTAFTGAGAFVATTGPSARMAAHVFAGNTRGAATPRSATMGTRIRGFPCPERAVRLLWAVIAPPRA